MTNFDIKLNKRRNALYSRPAVELTLEEAKAFFDKLKEAVDQLAPGWISIVDLTEARPRSPEVREVLEEITHYSVKSGMGRVVRIVAENATSQAHNLQFDRIARQYSYRTDVVFSLQEAKQLLGWSDG